MKKQVIKKIAEEDRKEKVKAAKEHDSLSVRLGTTSTKLEGNPVVILTTQE